MVNILLYVSTGIIVLSMIGYFIMILLNNKIVAESNGFDITKEMISEYNMINVIESKNYFSFYNIKRRIIKLSSKIYYGNDIGSLSVSLIEAGIAILDNSHNKFIDMFRKVISNLKVIYVIPLISVLINSVTYNISDAKTSVVIVFLFSIIIWMFVDIRVQSVNLIVDNIKKIKEVSGNSSKKIISFMNNILFLDKCIFLGQLLIIIRCIAIILKFN